MISQIRHQLRAQFIGAILIALITVDAIQEIVGSLVAPLQMKVERAYRSALGEALGQNALPMPDASYILPFIARAVLYAIIAALLFRWLYWEGPHPNATTTEPAAPSA